MSALPPKADMFSVNMNVFYVPLTDVGAQATSLRVLTGTVRPRFQL